MKRQISLVAALALASSIAFANQEIPIVEGEWKLIGNPGDGYNHSGATSTGSYVPVSLTGAVSLSEENTDDNDDVSLYNTLGLSEAQGADVTVYGRPGQLETQLDAQYGAANYDLNVSLVTVAGTGGATPYVMYIDANESDPNQPYIGKIEFTSQYIGETFNLAWGTSGTAGSSNNDYNASYTFEPNAHIYLTARADASGSTSTSIYTTNRLWLDIDANITNTSTMEINTTVMDVNLTIMSYRNGKWSIFDMNTSSGGGGAVNRGIEMNVRLSDDIFTGYSEVDYNNTKKAAAYWYKIEDNATANNGNIRVLVNDTTITSTDLETTMYNDTTNLGDSAWSLVAFPEGKIANSQTGLIIDTTVLAAGVDIRVGGLYGEYVDIDLQNYDFSGLTFVGGNSDENNASAFNYLMGLAEANGSFNSKIVAFPAQSQNAAANNADMLLLSDSDFNVTVASTSIGGKALVANARTPYGEQALAIHLNTSVIDGNQKAMNLVLSIPSISADIDMNITTAPAGWAAGNAVALGTFQSRVLGTIPANSGGLIDSADLNGTLFDANFDGIYDDLLIAFAAPTDRTTLSSSAFARFSIMENTYVKTYFNDINTTYDDGNLTVAYIAGSDRNITMFKSTADINITTAGVLSIHTDTQHGISIDDHNQSFDVFTSNDGNFTTIISNSPYVDLVEVNNTTNFLEDIEFDSNFDAGTNRSYTAYTDYNGTYPAGTDINYTSGFISYVWTLDNLVAQIDNVGTNGDLSDGDVYSSSSRSTNNLSLLPVWSASPLTVDTNNVFGLLQGMTTSHRIEEIWTYKADGYKLWYSTDLDVAPSEWLGKGSSLFTSQIGDGFWLKTKTGETFSMTAGSFSGETGVKTITHFDNEADKSYNYIFRENILSAPTSTYIDGFDSSDGNITANIPFVMTLKRGSDSEGGLYINSAGSAGYQFNINPYTIKHATDQVSLSANADTTLYFYDGMASSPASSTISVDSYTVPTTPTVAIDSSYIITASNFVTSTDETVVNSESTLGFIDAINEANLTVNDITSTTMMTNISTNGKIQPTDINEPTTPKLYTYKFVTRKNINQEGNTSHFLYSDIDTISFVPIFGARLNSPLTSASTITDVSELNQTRPMLYSEGNGSVVVSETGEDLYHLGSIMTYMAADTTATTRSDKFDQNGSIINDTTRTFISTGASATTDYDTNGLSLEASSVTGVGGVSVAYRPMEDAGAGGTVFETQLVIGGTAAASYYDGVEIDVQIATTAEYDGSIFYVYYNNNDTNVSVYYGTFDYQDSNTSVNVPLTRIVGITDEGDSATIVSTVAQVPCFATRDDSTLCD